MPAILVVGTANVCRSASAEILLAHLLAGGGEWTVRSAGTAAVPGQPLCPDASSRLFDAGVPAAALPHSARQLDAALVSSADLILTTTADQRALVASLQPGAAARTFTLLEAVRLSRLMPPRGDVARPVDALVRDLQAARPLLVAPPSRGRGKRRAVASSVDLPDGHVHDHRAALQRVHEAVAELAELLARSR